MMKRAGRVHVLRGLGLAVLIALVTWGGVEGYGTVRASSLVESLKTASTADVEPIIKQLSGYRRWANRRLVRLLGESEKTSRDHLHASLALLPVDASQAEYLYDRLLNADPIDLQVIWKLLQDNHQAPVDRLWKVLNDPKADTDRRFRAACALANVEPDGERSNGMQWLVSSLIGCWSRFSRTPAITHLLSSHCDPCVIGSWLRCLEPFEIRASWSPNGPWRRAFCPTTPPTSRTCWPTCSWTPLRPSLPSSSRRPKLWPLRL